MRRGGADLAGRPARLRPLRRRHCKSYDFYWFFFNLVRILCTAKQDAAARMTIPTGPAAGGAEREMLRLADPAPIVSTQNPIVSSPMLEREDALTSTASRIVRDGWGGALPTTQGIVSTSEAEAIGWTDSTIRRSRLHLAVGAQKAMS